MKLLAFLEEKADLIGEQIERMEEAFDSAGKDLFDIPPRHIAKMMTEGSETYLTKALYESLDTTNKEELEELGWTLDRINYKTAVFHEFTRTLINLVVEMIKVEDEREGKAIATKFKHLNSRDDEDTPKTDDIDVAIDTEHY